jgi:putative chitinase
MTAKATAKATAKTTISREIFFAPVRTKLFGNKMRQSQVDGMNAILAEFERQKLSDRRWLAYMLATAYHETCREMQAIEEYGKGKGYDYGKHLKRSRVPYPATMPLYYGRGLVQITWYENYELMGRLLKIDLLRKPELACQLDVAIKIMFEGMLKGASSFGDFTGRCLEMYFNDKTEDPLNARRIINGMDCAEKIKGYYEIFKTALAA